MKIGFSFFLFLLLLVGCSERQAEKKVAPATLITVTQVQVVALEVSEQTLGNLEAVNDPKIAAEIAGKLIDVTVRAGESVKRGQVLARIDSTDSAYQAAVDQGEMRRLSVLLDQQERLVARQTELVRKNFISKNALDEVSAQRDALKSQLTSAQARAKLSQNNTRKSEIISPLDGVVEEQFLTVGDYVKPGDPIFRLVSNTKLRAHLPFPESAASRLKIGMPVRLNSPLLPNMPIEAVVEDIKPTVGDGSRNIDVIARLSNPGVLKAGGSVDALVVTGQRERAVVVPEQSVVLRPAGKVVYLIVDGKTRQQVVQVGSKQRGVVEITDGLVGGETIALDGAGFLSENVTVNVKEASKNSEPVLK